MASFGVPLAGMKPIIQSSVCSDVARGLHLRRPGLDRHLPRRREPDTGRRARGWPRPASGRSPRRPRPGWSRRSIGRGLVGRDHIALGVADLSIRWGVMITPPLAIPAATSAFCSGGGAGRCTARWRCRPTSAWLFGRRGRRRWTG